MALTFLFFSKSSSKHYHRSFIKTILRLMLHNSPIKDSLKKEIHTPSTPHKQLDPKTKSRQ